MGFWDNLKGSMNQMNDSLRGKISQFKNSDFANGAMAMCALVAAADGSIDTAERHKTASFIMANDMLKVFPASELRDKFDLYCDKLNKDFDFGKIEAIQTIAKLKKKEDQARAVIQVGIIIGGADGNFDSGEKKVVREACNAVGINPAEFDL
ncbi:MAG: tellurite resistance TerB family protein [Nitrospirae bacterium]|uniref:tellurite resistance TerB family protein n=1 Tax=Candidatus Magnetobacterium casense TaxID=1455061 RepID=UPI00058D443C|nr:tellurite resistance TerB family protein [Candidatus Magnetobacterium casensis]MBF0336581.1 tellurite resistance TerB family protein [Nitrospirota bacterium]